MSRSGTEDVVDFFDIVGGDFETWFTRRRLRRAEDETTALRNDVESVERALFEEVHRTQQMIAVLAETLAERGVIDRAAFQAKLASAARKPLRTGASKATTSSTCAGCGAAVTPSNSYLRGDRRLCSSCYDSE
jgi:hypothetical protein